MSNQNEKNQSGMMDAMNDGVENIMDAVGNMFGEESHAGNGTTKQGSMNNLSKDDAKIASALAEIAQSTISNKNEKKE
jgi:hypothetical protein